MSRVTTMPSASLGGARGRTRQAILEAARMALAEDPSASLSDIAAVAQVARSTVHRYFPERSELISSLVEHVHELRVDAIERSEPSCGPPALAFHRVVEHQLDILPILSYLRTAPEVVIDADLMSLLEAGDGVVGELLDRMALGDTGFPPDWPRRVFWTVLGAAVDLMRRGAPKQRVVEAMVVSLTHGVVDRVGCRLHDGRVTDPTRGNPSQTTAATRRPLPSQVRC